MRPGDSFRAVFVGGPFSHALTPSGAFDPALRQLLETVIDACERAGFVVFSAHRSENFGQDPFEASPDEVTERDFGWMQRCDVYVCLLPNHVDGLPYRSDGSCIELGWASVLKKPTVVVREMDSPFTDLILGLGVLGPVCHLSLREVMNDPGEVVRTLKPLLQA